jgi:hypothetical protein
MTDELRGPIGALAFSVCQTLCWGLDHNVGATVPVDGGRSAV